MEKIVLLTTVTIGWDVILVELLVVFGIALVLTIVLGVIAFMKYKKCIEALHSKNWNYILQQEGQLKRMVKAKSTPLYDDCMYMLAVANFELCNDKEFLAYVEALKTTRYLPFKLYLKANYLIVTSNNATSELKDLLKQLSSLDENSAKKCFAISNLLYKIKFEGHVCTQEETETIEGMISERTKKVFLKT